MLIDAEAQTEELPKDSMRDGTPKSSSAQEPELIEFNDDMGTLKCSSFAFLVSCINYNFSHKVDTFSWAFKLYFVYI